MCANVALFPCADINYLDYVWRIIIGFGALPCVATIYLRSTLPETPRYTTDVSPHSPIRCALDPPRKRLSSVLHAFLRRKASYWS